MSVKVKICGLSTRATLYAAVTGGAAYVGFVFFEKSPRHLSINTARDLAATVPAGIAKVALSVNANDAYLDAITETVPLDMLQLHGTESPERVTEIKARYGLPVMKALGISEAADLNAIAAYCEVADQILIDAKPPKTANRPGGNGLPFDWKLIAGRRWSLPWMLSGGLVAENVADAVRLTGACQIDLSSGVEDAPGVKSVAKITRFLEVSNAI